MCVYVCSVLSITNANGQATAVDTSTLLPSAPDLFQLLGLFFHTRLPRTRGKRKRGQAQERTGMEGWRSKGNKEGGSEDCFCQIQLTQFNTIINRFKGSVIPIPVIAQITQIDTFGFSFCDKAIAGHIPHLFFGTGI